MVNMLHTTDTATVQTLITAVDATTKRTTTTWTTVYTDEPCRLSYTTAPAIMDGETPQVLQFITLFIDVNLDIPAGSRITITRHGKATTFKASGEPKKYFFTGHQQINLDKEGGMA